MTSFYLTFVRWVAEVVSESVDLILHRNYEVPILLHIYLNKSIFDQKIDF